jgi:pantothenate kinase type III
MVEGMIAEYRREIGSDTITVGTGGYAQLLAEDGVFDVYDAYLSLRGLLLAAETVS